MKKSQSKLIYETECSVSAEHSGLSVPAAFLVILGSGSPQTHQQETSPSWESQVHAKTHQLHHDALAELELQKNHPRKQHKHTHWSLI